MEKEHAHEPGIGDVEVELGGVQKFLRPSLNAAKALSKLSGGLIGVMRRLEQLDFEVICFVVAHGLGVSPTTKELPDLVYKAGISELAGKCMVFVGNLSNGGVPPQPVVEEDGEGGNP